VPVWQIASVKRNDACGLYQNYADEYVATNRDSGRMVAHSPSIRKLVAVLKRKGINLSQIIVEKVPPKDTVVIY
jgi:hypothetical protein